MYILGVIKKIVGKIDDTEYLEKLFDDLSDLHRRLGVEASGMDIFGKVFCKVYSTLPKIENAKLEVYVWRI